MLQCIDSPLGHVLSAQVGSAGGVAVGGAVVDDDDDDDTGGKSAEDVVDDAGEAASLVLQLHPIFSNHVGQERDTWRQLTHKQ